MISVTDLRTGVAFEDQGQIYQVITYEHLKFGRGSANVKVKVRNLYSGSVTEKSFISGAKVKPINLEKIKAQYLYSDPQGFHFMDSKTFEQVSLSKEKLGKQVDFLKEGMGVALLTFEGDPLSLDLPIKMEFEVAETGPGIRGDSVSNIYKDAVLENDLTVRVPLFIKAGDRVLVDTRSGEYVERVK